MCRHLTVVHNKFACPQEEALNKLQAPADPSAQLSSPAKISTAHEQLTTSTPAVTAYGTRPYSAEQLQNSAHCALQKLSPSIDFAVQKPSPSIQRALREPSPIVHFALQHPSLSVQCALQIF